MKIQTFLLLLFCSVTVFGQIENPNSTVDFNMEDNTLKDPDGLELPAIKKPSLTNFDDKRTPTLDLGEDEDQKVDFTKDDGLVDYTTNKTPKAFTKDKEASPEYGRDQNLGDVRTTGGIVQIKYRDHEYVDGDRIRVFVNGDVVRGDIALGGSFGGFTLTLDEGFNKIVFQALNQGSSGPNTAELHVYNEKGQLISAKEWNLLTGHKATIVVVKE